MLKNRLIFLIIVGLLFIIMVALQHYAPKPVDWGVNLWSSSKAPYGCYVIKEILNRKIADKNVVQNNISLYEAKSTGILSDKNLVVITDHFAPDEYDLSTLLAYVAEGNTVFISAFDFGSSVADTLKFEVHAPLIDTSAFGKGKEVLNFLNPKLKRDSAYIFTRKMPLNYFSSFDSLHTSQLGIDRFDELNYISTLYGKGKFLLHCQPLAFTNYHILYGNSDYPSAALAYLTDAAIIWDSYYKPGKKVNVSPLRYILSETALRSAYYLFLISILLYMIFQGKRRQRKIPIIKPLQNSSLLFIQTIGKLYFKSSNHADLAKKKATYFNEFLRDRYYLNTINSKEETLQRIASKSGVKYATVKEIIVLIEVLQKQEIVSSNNLINLHIKMESFYSTCI